MIQLQPNDVLEKLEFDKIKELLLRECLGRAGKERIANLPIETTLARIEHKLLQVNEFKQAIVEGEQIPVSAYPDLSEELKMLEVEGYVLAVEGLQRINKLLRQVAGIFQFFKAEQQESYPNLYDLLRKLHFDSSLIKAIDQVIDEEGEIKSDASPELQKIRRGIAVKQRELDKQFRQIISQLKQKGWLTDSVESFRNGRRVLSVPSEHKRKIRGIIHDESTTGKTAFIEPEAIIDINNDIFDMETEERREIYRLLKALSELLRPYRETLHDYEQLIAQFDVIQAKAQLAIRLQGQLPKLSTDRMLDIRQGYHPLLFLKNKKLDRPTIPFTLHLKNNNRILMLSGPNAGGKSILMKSIGLLQLMLQAGMLVPVSPDSEFGVFSKIFADIGDQQSLEDDLRHL